MFSIAESGTSFGRIAEDVRSWCAMYVLRSGQVRVQFSFEEKLSLRSGILVRHNKKRFGTSFKITAGETIDKVYSTTSKCGFVSSIVGRIIYFFPCFRSEKCEKVTMVSKIQPSVGEC